MTKKDPGRDGRLGKPAPRGGGHSKAAENAMQSESSGPRGSRIRVIKNRGYEAQNQRKKG